MNGKADWAVREDARVARQIADNAREVMETGEVPEAEADSALRRRISTALDAAQHRKALNDLITISIVIAGLPPILLLAAGYVVAWAFAGFGPKR